MGDSNSIMAPSRGMTRETASIKNVIRKTLPLKELPETKQNEIQHSHTVTNLSALEVCSEAQPLTQFPQCKVTGFVSHGLTLVVCQSWQTGLFLCVQSCAVCNTLVSYTSDILSFNKISKEKLKKLMNKKCNGKARHSSHFVTPGLRSLMREDLSVRPARTTSQDSDSGKTGQTCNDAMNIVTYSPIEKMSKGVCVKFS